MNGRLSTADLQLKAGLFLKRHNFRLRSKFGEGCPDLLKVTDVRTTLALVNEYFNSEMQTVTDTPTVLDCAMNFVEAAGETLKTTSWCAFLKSPETFRVDFGHDFRTLCLLLRFLSITLC